MFEFVEKEVFFVVREIYYSFECILIKGFMKFFFISLLKVILVWDFLFEIMEMIVV